LDVKGFTIDSSSTLDVDDAIWVESDSRGWTITVCIANVAAAISKGSTFDDTARRRVQTLYLAGGRSTPMIPRHFSEGSCSLFEGKQRSVMAIRIRLDHMLDPQGLPQIDESKLISKKKLSYADIPNIIENESAQLHKEISLAARLATALVDKRRNNGAFVLYDLANGWIMTESGRVRKLKYVRETIGHVIVQELMILTNMELARFCLEKEIPVPFRNHTARTSAPPRQRMMDLLEQGISGPVQEFERAQDSFMMIMNEAVYGPTLEGHYGLNLRAYIHGTSPIRRFADLITQRQIIGHINGGNLAYTKGEVREMCEHINVVMATKAQEESEVATTRANKRGTKAIDEGGLSRLSVREFERVVKASVCGDSHKPDVAMEFLRRLKRDEASLVDMYYLLLESGESWVETRKSILSHLVEHPNKATEVANVAGQLGGWSEPKFFIQQKGEGDSLVHESTVKFDKPKLAIGPIRASSKRLAKQVLIVETFAEYICEPKPQWPKVDAELPNKALRKLDVDSINPIGELMEYCQFTGIDLPQYKSDRYVYDNNNPKFVVSCEAAGLHVKSSPSDSKKQAKKESARRAIQLILERT